MQCVLDTDKKRYFMFVTIHIYIYICMYVCMDDGVLVQLAGIFIIYFINVFIYYQSERKQSIITCDNYTKYATIPVGPVA